MNLDKAKKFLSGRRGLMERIRSACSGVDNIIWVHSASYGEFEEVKPILEAIRRKSGDVHILVTFFSPSGYEYHRNEPLADWVFYLPLATRRNARRFFDAAHPSKIIISISDYWPAFLFEARRRGVPAFLTSARFEPGMFYFKPLGFVYRDIFRTCFTKMFVRDERSKKLIESIGVKNTTLAGDPRIDRVLALSRGQWHNEIVERWCGGRKVFVAGSTMKVGDDDLMIALCNSHPEDRVMIIPHDIDRDEIAYLRRSIKGGTALYSELQAGDEAGYDNNVLIVDTVGMLSRLYRYGYAAYVGAGFDKFPHSLLEPASYGIPVCYGPLFGSYYHCQALIDAGAGTSVSNAGEFCAWFDSLSDEQYLARAGKAAMEYCLRGEGVADRVASEILL